MNAIRWGFEILMPPGTTDPWAAVVMQPEGHQMHADLATRLARAGCKRVTTREYVGVQWPDTRCTVTVQLIGGEPCFTEAHTGASRLMATEALAVSPTFTDAAARGRVLLMLVPPGTLTMQPPPEGGDSAGVLPGELAELAGKQIEAAIGRREVLAGMARVLDAPAPAPRGGTAYRPHRR